MSTENKNQPAFPLITKGGTIQDGLTKREYFAAMALQGLCASVSPVSENAKDCAEAAVKYADALLHQLNQK